MKKAVNVVYELCTVLLCLTLQAQGNEKQRAGRANLLAFGTAHNKHLGIGMDLEMPFMTVPIKRTLDANGGEKALININTGSLITAGVLAGGGLIVGHLFRSMFPQFREESHLFGGIKRNERFVDVSPNDKDFLAIFEGFKLRYRNATGEKVETSMPKAITRIEKSLLEHDVKLSACLEKSICSFVYKSSENVHAGQASAMQKIINSFTNITWLMSTLAEYPKFYEAMKAGKMSSSAYCDLRYPECKWLNPEEKLHELVRTYVNFI